MKEKLERQKLKEAKKKDAANGRRLRKRQLLIKKKSIEDELQMIRKQDLKDKSETDGEKDQPKSQGKDHKKVNLTTKIEKDGKTDEKEHKHKKKHHVHHKS